jgi:hypothetical protein
MYPFKFNKKIKNNIIEIDNLNNKEYSINEYLRYIHKESKKGRIPLIIVGSGISTSNVIIFDPNNKSPKGLPTLLEMVEEIRKYLLEKKDDVDVKELFSELFEKNNNYELSEFVDREW